MYSDIFCKVYNEFGWNYYPEIFGEQLLQWLQNNHITVKNSMDLACGTGILCRILRDHGIAAAGMDLSVGMIDIAKQNSPNIPFEVADMITFCPQQQFDLVTCTGDAINHIATPADILRIFQNVYIYTAKGGHFIFDILNRNEVSTSEPFEMEFNDTVRVWFQMTQPDINSVNLCIRVYEQDLLQFEENIHETIHNPAMICRMLEQCGFTVEKCSDTLSDDPHCHGTTWFVIAQK